VIQVSRRFREKQKFAAELFAARALVVQASKKTGNRERRELVIMADFIDFSCFREAGHGIHRQNIEVQRLRRRVCVHGGRAVVFPRQTIQERPQALQTVQGEACARGPARALGDADDLFGVQSGDDGALQADTGPACALQVVLPEAERESGPDGWIYAFSLF
jgi:hypothetical protein